MRAKKKRNSRIIELHAQGVSPTSLAARHRVTVGRITQIVSANSAVVARRAELEAHYGKRPNIAQLSDDTPLDVLILVGSESHGWMVRVMALSSGRNPIRTLGELRTMSDSEFLARRGVGAGLFAEIRAHCPSRVRAKRDGRVKVSRTATERPMAKPRASRLARQSAN